MTTTKRRKLRRESGLESYLKGIDGLLLKPDEEQVLAKVIQQGKQSDAILNEKRHSLSDEEKITLLEKVRKGQEAKETLVKRNLRLVVSIAKQYPTKPPLVTFEDLIEEGNLGLFDAAKRFQPKGTKFSTYASYWIKRAILKALYDQTRTIRIPKHMLTKINMYMSVVAEFLDKEKRKPQPREIATIMSVPLRTIRTIQRALPIFNTMSLDGHRTSEGKSLQILMPEHKAFALIAHSDLNTQKEVIERALDKLLPREREVIILRFGLFGETTHTLKEIGKRVGLTRERVR